MPAALEVDYGPELARERISERVRDKQHQAWNKAKRTGISFIGPRRVLRLPHTKRAKSYEVFGSLNPQFAVPGHRGAASSDLVSFPPQTAKACDLTSPMQSGWPQDAHELHLGAAERKRFVRTTYIELSLSREPVGAVDPTQVGQKPEM